jgi:hypothetical protein
MFVFTELIYPPGEFKGYSSVIWHPQSMMQSEDWQLRGQRSRFGWVLDWGINACFRALHLMEAYSWISPWKPWVDHHCSICASKSTICGMRHQCKVIGLSPRMDALPSSIIRLFFRTNVNQSKLYINNITNKERNVVRLVEQTTMGISVNLLLWGLSKSDTASITIQQLMILTAYIVYEHAKPYPQSWLDIY